MTDTTDMLLDQLALVRGRRRAQLDAAFGAGGGDLEIDSKEGQTVAMRMEILLDMEGLIRPEDQTRTNLTTVRSLERLIERRRSERKGD
jgi:hypothetical protein